MSNGKRNPVSDAEAAVTVAKNELLGISHRLEDIRLRLQRTENQYERVIVNPMPEWKSREFADEDAVAVMADDAFAAMRTDVAAEKEPMKRLCGQAALAKLVAGVIADKRARLRKLSDRVKSGDAGSEAEVAVAKKRIAHIEQMLVALNDRFSAVVGDFAHTRRQVLAKVVSLTATLDDIFPKGCTAYAVRFNGADDIERPLKSLDEMNERMKAEPKSGKMPTLAFGGRSR